MKKGNIFKKNLPYQSEFSHRASWAVNHMGWAKMKKDNRRIAKNRFRREAKKEMEEINNDR